MPYVLIANTMQIIETLDAGEHVSRYAPERLRNGVGRNLIRLDCVTRAPAILADHESHADVGVMNAGL